MPPPKGRPDAAAAGADHRLVVRQLRRRGDAGARGQRHRKPKDKILLMATGRDAPRRAASACSRPSRCAPRAAVGRRGGLRHRRHQGSARRAASATPSPSRAKPASEPLPGFKEMQPQVFAGLFPVEANEYDALRDALEKLQAQRRRAALRAGGVAGAGLRLPLRLPRHAAHGNRAGAPGARVRHGPDHHRADGGVRGRA